jgi:hypothetical protein
MTSVLCLCVQFGGFAGDKGLGFADQAVDEDELAAPLHKMLTHAAWLLVGGQRNFPQIS